MWTLADTFRFERRSARERLDTLAAGRTPRSESSVYAPRSERSIRSERGLALLLSCAGIRLRPTAFLFMSALLGALVCAVLQQFLSPGLIPVTFLGGGMLPYLYVEGRATKRAETFSRDYPSVMLAAASSLKTGMTPYQALERATKLLPKASVVRIEVDRLTSQLSRGVPREEAIAQFGATIRQPDLDLFRTAFLLALENGGRFAPTLERLALVSKDRAMLIERARVSTTTMRMTAHILLVVAPVLVLIVSVRTPDFWDTILYEPTANSVASTGMALIAVSYAVLRRMSNFKP